MLSKVQHIWFYVVCLLFIMGNAIGVYYDFYFLPLLPAALAVLLMALFAIDKLILFITFLVPVSITFHNIGLGGIGIILPTEPIIVLLMVIGFVKFMTDSGEAWRGIFSNTLTIAILINLGWLLLTTLTSSMPLVSAKYWLSRAWYIVVFYFLGVQLFKNIHNVSRFFWCFLIPLMGVVIYVQIRHSQHGFVRDGFPYMIQPFFTIHGVYAATVAFFTPILLVFALKGKNLEYSPLRRAFMAFATLLFGMAVTFSYTRAAWLSLMAALAALVVFYIKIPIKVIFSSVILALLVIVIFQKDIMLKLSENEQGSSASSNLEEHLESVSNIKNDPSNLERINRWNCAIRMFEERPLTGWGPGTYQFQYAPFQRSKDLTVISTNFGDVGHAHSEYLGPLAESGFIGMFSWIAVFLITIYKGMRLHYFGRNKKVRTYALAILLGLITYYSHGVLNSYIDYDKIAVPLWGCAAILTAMELYHNKEEEIS